MSRDFRVRQNVVPRRGDLGVLEQHVHILRHAGRLDLLRACQYRYIRTITSAAYFPLLEEQYALNPVKQLRYVVELR